MLLFASPLLPGAPLPERILLLLGRPDASGAEFGSAAESRTAALNDYVRSIPNPVSFDARKNAPDSWPLVHPGPSNPAAGAESYSFHVRFDVQDPPARPLRLILGIVNSQGASPPVVRVRLNETTLDGLELPRGPLSAMPEPEGWWRPSAAVLEVPANAIAKGENRLELTLDSGDWFVYDYLYLGTRAKPFDLSRRSDSLLERFLAGPMAEVEAVVFAARYPGNATPDGHWYANFGYYAHDADVAAYGDGGSRLYVWNPRSGELKVILDDPEGGIRDPQVDYEGRKILFSYRPGGTPHYHLYEIDVSGSGLRRLTDGAYDDLEPSYLPDGGIVFVSSRANRWVNCWMTQVATLYRSDGDGRNIRPLSANIEQDNTPWPMPDGRILYTRWEYVDRSQVSYHHLWTANPDGTNQMTWYGNLHPGTVMIDAKPIPGSDKVVASFSPGHGAKEHAGILAVVDPNAGPDDRSGARRVSVSADLRDPWAFSEGAFLAARGPALVLVDGSGAEQEVFRLPDADIEAGLILNEPRPLSPRRREAVIPPRVDLSQPTGRLIMADIYQGRNMEGVRRGEIKKLLVLETLPMPIHYNGGMYPISYGGTFTLERILGTVPVEADGSAYFELPALRPVFFVALDENDESVKRMQSFHTVAPGEVSGCIGCHESRTQAPPSSLGGAGQQLLALERQASEIEPIPDIPEVIDFPRDIQPLLDKHCVTCHSYDRPLGDVVLSGDRGPVFSHSYFMLTARGQMGDGRNRPESNYAPRTLGSSASPLLEKITPRHHGVDVSPWEKKLIRLWIESAAAYAGTYASLGTGSLGDYGRDEPRRPDLEWASTKAAAKVVERRCAGCHSGELTLPRTPSDDVDPIAFGRAAKAPAKPPRWPISRHLMYNLSRPQQSLMLLAPLSRADEGYEVCESKDGRPVFADTSDPDYQTLLRTIEDAKRWLDETKRFDMPGFQPRQDWFREMTRYGILPAASDSTKPIDFYAVEQRYWESLWYQPRRAE